ncbi:MAG: UDP-glucose-4-epimerase [Dehalococcoidia bacterium]|nr:UDP-glucose-4-epimerase [Dehalococcoidia bacterium]
MKVLVTGGAGYIGSVTARRLLAEGHGVVVLDNLSQGHREGVPEGAELVVGDVCDAAVLDKVFAQGDFDAVMHFAADSVVSSSMTDPQRYFRTNVTGGLALLDAMLRHGTKRLVFSSSAAVYGTPEEIPIREDHSKEPVNSYGESKWLFERILKWYGRAYQLLHISFRYFNAAGAAYGIGEDHRPETHLIPNVLRAAQGPSNGVTIFGNDFPTSDGTCVRDYVHVDDIAAAHVLALGHLEDMSGEVFNLGLGRGYSVQDVVDVTRQVTGVNLPVHVGPRRPGDPAALVASPERARNLLGWRPQHTELIDIIGSAWEWRRRHLDGYGSSL